jgi:L-2-hydroxyglutarate oxidase LhgO
MFKIEVAIIGSGVIGLAIARALALRGFQVLVLEKEAAIGTGTSSRNSEVIHSGIYYEPGSLKARLCVHGRRLLYDYCRDRGIAHRRCGKLVVASDSDESDYLAKLLQRAERNDVEDIALIGTEKLKALEPQLNGSCALLASCTGIVDSHSLMLSYQADIESAGGTLVFRTPVVAARTEGEQIILETGGKDASQLKANLVINAAGLEAWSFSENVIGLDPSTIPQKHLAKGNYFALCGVKSPFRHLVYPVPEPGGLGIHLTFDLGGQARFGPDVEWVRTVDYSVDERRSDRFYTAIRRYWPEIPSEALIPAYSGIRPKTTAVGQCDFAIQGPADTGHPGYIALYGIESPGLTASLAIGEHVAQLAGGT